MLPKSLIHKLSICLIAGLICGITVLRIGDRFLSFIIPVPVVIGVSVAILVASLCSAFVWHRRHQSNRLDNAKVNAFWLGVMRYGIAFDLAMFGFQKIFHLQFTTPLGMLDEPYSSFSGQWLTWSYFGHSYGFAFTIGASQIVGSMLLLFNRTRLLGAVFLLPVMLNIILIDYFYELDLGVLIHALILLAGLIYLLLLDYQRLVAFFIQYRGTDAVQVNRVVKLAGRMSILVLPLLIIATYGSPDKHPGMTGKYAVTDLRINNVPKMTETCSDSLLTTVYFDIANDCVFKFNSLERRMFGSYDLQEGNGQIHITWYHPPNARGTSFDGVVKRNNETEIELVGRFQNDSMRVKLQRQEL